MRGFEFILLMMYLSVIALYMIGLWCFVVSYQRYKFSPYWLIVAGVLILAPVFLFPLCGNLRYSAAKRKNRPTEELAQNLLYKRMG